MTVSDRTRDFKWPRVSHPGENGRCTVSDLLSTLRQSFGHASFRAGQEAVISAVLEGRDVLAVMPTGAGKSLGYQLPALLLRGLTIVVSPLISLMKDQVDALNRRGIAAASVHSAMEVADRNRAIDAATAGALRLLFVAPERFAAPAFLRVLDRAPVARFVVDEAHCVSEWGHDFRPDYRRLSSAAARCRRGDGLPGRPPMAAFTATATPEVRDDIVSLLGLISPRVFVAGFDRPNIALDVTPVFGDHHKHELLPALVGGRRGLVYASTRRGAEAAAVTLRASGIAAAAYHAGLADRERESVQSGFADGSLLVVCATNAFGMGIDRPDIELVVHVDIPGSLEAYYQEIGRAGRDGRAATAVLLWNYADVRTREFLIDRAREDADRDAIAVDPAELQRRKALEHRKLRRMVAYADTAACLRSTILSYFGDTPVRTPCGGCSTCARLAPLDADQLLVVRKVLAGIARAGERYGARRIAAMLAGETDGLPEALSRLSTTGLLRPEGPRTIQRWIEATVAGGLVRVSDDKYRLLSLTPAGRDVMTGRATDARLPAPARAVEPMRPRTPKRRGARATLGDPAPPDSALMERLRRWRREQASQRAVPAFVVLHDRTLERIASEAPASLSALRDIPGIGDAKLELYGDSILAIVAGKETYAAKG